MYSSIENFLQTLEEQLPNICSSQDLIKFRIYLTESGLSRARSRGLSPKFIKFPNRRIIYLKSDVLAWMRELYHENKK